jgi:hypothetical protein
LPFTIQEFTIHHSIIHNSKNGGGGIHNSPFKTSQLKSAAHALPFTIHHSIIHNSKKGGRGHSPFTIQKFTINPFTIHNLKSETLR